MSSNLNGMRLPASTRTMGIVWTRFENAANLASATMKIRRANIERSSHLPVKRIHPDGGGPGEVQGGGVEGDEDNVEEDLKPKTKKNKFNKIFKNFYDKWKR